MLNRYFTPELSDSQISEIVTCCVEDLATARKSLDGLKVVVKLPLGHEGTPSCMVHLTEYSHDQIITEMQTPDWNPEL